MAVSVKKSAGERQSGLSRGRASWHFSRMATQVLAVGAEMPESFAMWFSGVGVVLCWAQMVRKLRKVGMLHVLMWRVT